MVAEKVFINGVSIKEKSFDNGDSILKVSLKDEGVDQLKELLNKDGWVNIDIKKRREVGAKGQTHYMQLNTYQPKEHSPHDPGDENDELPF